MKEILRLVRKDFDCMENRDAEIEKTVATFIEDNGALTAHGKADKWLKEQEPVRLYLGWDGEIYPQFKLVKERAL